MTCLASLCANLFFLSLEKTHLKCTKIASFACTIYKRKQSGPSLL